MVFASMMNDQARAGVTALAAKAIAPDVSNGAKRHSNADAESQLIAEARCPS